MVGLVQPLLLQEEGFGIIAPEREVGRRHDREAVDDERRQRLQIGGAEEAVDDLLGTGGGEQM
jgi:hypothetical protein